MSKVVYTIVKNEKDGEKDYWTRIGVAVDNRDGSLNVLLNALPVNGTLHIREEKPRNQDWQDDEPGF